MSSRHDRDSGCSSHSGSCLADLLRAETTFWNCSVDKPSASVSSINEAGPHERLEQLMSQPSNRVCADCGAPDPKWVSLRFGAVICIKCSGVHRSLGAHITKVYSVNLDEWSDEQVDTLMELGGNAVVNLKYEASIPVAARKPNPDSSSQDRADFIRSKYEHQQFVFSEETLMCPFPTAVSVSVCGETNSSTCSSSSSSSSTSSNSCLHLPHHPHHNHDNKRHLEKQATRHRIGHTLRNSWGRKETTENHHKKKNSSIGMVEFVGLIKINVEKGTDLAVRDMVSSDPYVMLSLGHQHVKTRVIRNNLNPVWNEQLMLSIPEKVPPLKVHVFDKDTFTHDDFMGEAEIDIQPLLAAAREYEHLAANQQETTSAEEWMMCSTSRENTITIVDGKVKQRINLKLQHVERGEIDIQLECVPLNQ